MAFEQASHLTCLSVFSNHLGLFRDWITQCFSLSSPDFTKSPCSHCHVMTKWLERVICKHCPQFPFYGFFWTHSFRTSIPPLHRNRSGQGRRDIHVNQPHCAWLAISWLTRLLPLIKTRTSLGFLDTSASQFSSYLSGCSPQSSSLVPSHFLTH